MFYKKNVNKIDIQTQFEILCQQINDLKPIDEDVKGWFKSKPINFENQYYISATPHSKLLMKEHISALKNL